MSAPLPDISVVVFASRQGHLLHGSILSVKRAVEQAHEAGLFVEVYIATYAPDQKTAAWVAERAPYRSIDLVGSCLGTVRNLALDKTIGHHVAFLEGADIWSRNFLVDAVTQDQGAKSNIVWRPAISIGFSDNYFDSAGYSVRQIPDSESLHRSTILVDNPFPPTFFARRQILETHRFPAQDPDRGWNDIDWWWSANLLGHGIIQRTIPDTLHYFRTSLAQERERERGPARLGPTALELGRRPQG